MDQLNEIQDYENDQIIDSIPYSTDDEDSDEDIEEYLDEYLDENSESADDNSEIIPNDSNPIAQFQNTIENLLNGHINFTHRPISPGHRPISPGHRPISPSHQPIALNYEILKKLVGGDPSSARSISRKKNYYKFQNELNECKNTLQNIASRIKYDKKSFAILITNLPKCNINDYDYNRWILQNDINTNGVAEEEQDEFMVSFMDINPIEEIINILNIQCVSEEDNDEQFMLYYNACNNAVQYIIGFIMDYMNYNFDIMKKFMWIFVTLAIKYEHRAIKYLINSPYYDPKVLLLKDNALNSYSPLEYLLNDFTPELYNHINNNNVLLELIKQHIEQNESNPLLFAVNHIKDVVEQIDGVKELLLTKSNLLFASACLNNIESAKYLLQLELDSDIQEKMIKQPISLSNGEFTPLMLLPANDKVFAEVNAEVNSDLIFTILDSQYCDQELVEFKNIIYGTFLSIIANFNPEMIKIIIEKYPQFITDKLINMTYGRNGTSSILIELINNIDILKMVIKLPQFNRDLFSIEFLKILLSSNIDSFKELYNDGLLKNIKIEEVLINICDFDKEFGIELINTIEITEKSLQPKNSDNMNIIMILSRCGILDKVYDKLRPYITTEILDDRDDDNYNTYSYICKFFPEIAMDILKSDIFDKSILESDYYEGSIMLHVIFCTCNNENLLKALLDSDYVTEEMMDKTNDEGNNLLLEIDSNVNYDNSKLQLLTVLNSSKLTEKQFKHSNNKGHNIIILTDNIDIVVNHKYFSNEMLRHKDNDGNNYLHYCILFDDNIKDFDDISKNISKDILQDLLMETNNKGESCAMMACKTNKLELLKKILTKEVFLQRDTDDKTCVAYALFMSSNNQKSEELLNYLINHEYCSEEILYHAFTQYSEIQFSLECSRLIFNSKYCSTRMLMVTNRGSNQIMNCINCDFKLAENMIKSSYFNKNIMKQTDTRENSILNYLRDNKLLEYIITHEDFTEDLMFLPKPTNNICKLHSLLENGNIKLVKKLLRKAKCTEKILTTPFTHNGKTLLTFFSAYGLQVKHIMDLPYVTKDTLLFTDVTGKTLLHSSIIPRNAIIEILKHEKCSSELLEVVDNTGKTFLDIHPTIVCDVLESSYCTTKLLENTSVLIHSETLPEYFNKLINHPCFTKEILGKNLWKIFDSYELFDIFKNSRFYTDEIMNKNHNNVSMLMLILQEKQPIIVKEILESNIDFTPTFKSFIENIPFVVRVAYINFENYKLMMESKYITDELMLNKNMYQHTITMLMCTCVNKKNIKHFINSKYWDMQKYEKEIDNDSTMNFIQSPEILEYIIKNNKCDKIMVNMYNNAKESCLHYYARNSQELLQLILDSGLVSRETRQLQNIHGQTFLHIASMKEKIFKYVIKTNYISTKLLKKQDRYGKTVLMNCLQYCPDVFDNIIKNKMFDKKCFKQTDNAGNNIMIYIIKYAPNKMELFIKSKYFDTSMLKEINEDSYNPVFYACRYNAKIIKLLLDNNLLTKDLIFIHSHWGCALNIAAQFQPLAVKYILELPNITEIELKSINKINIKDDTIDKMFLEIACIYQPMAVKYAINSKYDLENIIMGQYFSTTVLASMYQPEALKIILESKYGSLKLLENKVGSEELCLHTAYAYQPMALKYIIESEHSTEEYLRSEDSIGYRLINIMKEIYPNLDSLADVKNLELVNEINELCDEKDSGLCSICCTFKTKVIFTSCLHTCCVGCSFKQHECPYCRKEIEHRKILY